MPIANVTKSALHQSSGAALLMLKRSNKPHAKRKSIALLDSGKGMPSRLLASSLRLGSLSTNCGFFQF